MVYSTYLGGSGANAAISAGHSASRLMGWRSDSSNNAYIVGITTSTDFPTTANGFQPNTAPPRQLSREPFSYRESTRRHESAAASLVYSTYLGGDNLDLSTAIALKPNSAVAYVTGTTGQPRSTSFPTFPTAAPGPFQATGDTGGTAFMSVLDTAQNGAASLTYSTFLGGAQNHRIRNRCRRSGQRLCRRGD